MKACGILLLGMSIFWTGVSFGQGVAPAAVQWQKTYSRASGEREPCLIRTFDDGFLLGGWSHSVINSGEWDYWAIRVDASGSALWDAVFGGSYLDFLRTAIQTPDGGFLLVGDSRSSEGTGNKTARLLGQNDVWVVRLDASGRKPWDKTYGGIYMDEARRARHEIHMPAMFALKVAADNCIMTESSNFVAVGDRIDIHAGFGQFV